MSIEERRSLRGKTSVNGILLFFTSTKGQMDGQHMNSI
jgi:hypothetical protein